MSVRKMTNGRIKSVTLVGLAALMCCRTPARAVDVVFDPTNFTKNVEQVRQQMELAQRMQEQVRNQLRMIESWRFSRINGVLNAMRDAQRVLAASGTYGVGGADGGLGETYPVRVALSRTEMQGRRLEWELRRRQSLVERRELTESTYRDLGANAQRVSEIVAKSNAAPGQTAAVQAGNELTASLVGQLQSLQAAEVSAARAEVEEAAKRQSESSHQTEQRARLMGDFATPSGTTPFQPFP